MDTVCQLMAAMRKVARVVPGAAAVIVGVCQLDYSRPGKPDIDWDNPAAKEQLVSDLVNDALAVLAGSPGRARRSGTPPRRTRWACWRWWRGGTWSRLGVGRDGRAVADRPGGRPGPGDLDGGPRGPARPQVQVQAARRVPGACGRRAGVWADHRLRDDDGRRAGQRRTRRTASRWPAATGFMVTVRAPVTGAWIDAASAGQGAGCPALRRRSRGRARPPGRSLEAHPEPGPEPQPEPEREGTGEQGRADDLEVYGDSAYGSGEARAAYRDAGRDTVISRSRCGRPCPAGSPSTTSPSARTTARSPARPGSPGR